MRGEWTCKLSQVPTLYWINHHEEEQIDLSIQRKEERRKEGKRKMWDGNTFLTIPSLNRFVGRERISSSEAPRGAAARSIGFTTTRKISTTHEQQQNRTPSESMIICMIMSEKHMRKRYGAVDVHLSSARAWNVHTMPTINHVNHRKFRILFSIINGELCRLYKKKPVNWTLEYIKINAGKERKGKKENKEECKVRIGCENSRFWGKMHKVVRILGARMARKQMKNGIACNYEIYTGW
jgi:hypothetical protein